MCADSGRGLTKNREFATRLESVKICRRHLSRNHILVLRDSADIGVEFVLPRLGNPFAAAVRTPNKMDQVAGKSPGHESFPFLCRPCGPRIRSFSPLPRPEGRGYQITPLRGYCIDGFSREAALEGSPGREPGHERRREKCELFTRWRFVLVFLRLDRHGELKGHAAIRVRVRCQMTAVCLNDSLTNTQSHAEPVGLRGEIRLE